MNNKLSIEPRVRSLVSYLEDIENGLLQIPSFQRDYVWSRDDVKDLFDSIKNRYPIGSVLLWKPGEELGYDKEKIGSYSTPKSKEEKVYILDGYQRLSTLFGCLTNPTKSILKRDTREWEELFDLYYDLEEEAFVYIRPKSYPAPFQVPVYILLNSSDFRQFARKEFEKIVDEGRIDKYYDRADKLSRVLLEYQISSVDIKNADISEAVEIFSRINSKGQSISFDWMANALSIRENFRFGSEIDNLIEELKQYNFEKIDRNIIFRCIQSSFGKLYIDNTRIEVLAKRVDFSSVTLYSLPKIKAAIRFLYEELLVLDSRLLPYNIQLIFLMDFFKKFENPTAQEIEKLKRWFWITTYSNYFTNYSLANQRKAYYHFHDFLNGKEDDPVYNDKPGLKFSVAEFPERISMGSVRAKALTLFLLNNSNNFKKIDVLEVNEYKINKLLPSLFLHGTDIFEFIENFASAENTIPIIEFNNGDNINVIKSKDLSSWLNFEFKGQMKQYFINEEMRKAFSKSEFERVLKIRKDLIQDAESNFTRKYDLDYEIILDMDDFAENYLSDRFNKKEN